MRLPRTTPTKSAKDNDSKLSRVPEDQSLSSQTTATSASPKNFAETWNKWQRQMPCLKKVKQKVLQIHPRWRWAFVIFWFGWKIVLAISLLVVMLKKQKTSPGIGRHPVQLTSDPAATRILYIVTTLSEYNTGSRSTIKGQDRLGEILLPVLVDSVSSLVGPPFYYDVDVFLIAAYKLEPEREELIRKTLPYGVGLQVWDDAAPLGYEAKHSPNKVIDNTRALARQHRYVIKDKFEYYDLFMAWEDDMRITGHHAKHFLDLSRQLNQLYKEAPERLEANDNVNDPRQTKFYGDISKGQLSRIIPGFMRVEALPEGRTHEAQTNILPIERDFEFLGGDEYHVDPKICCHVNMDPNMGTPEKPAAEDLIIWESNAKAFSLREFPALQGELEVSSHGEGSAALDWAVLMMGPGKRLKEEEKVGGYWTGRQGAFKDEDRPSGGVPDLIAQQGGWMLTRAQIFKMHSQLCLDSFLPPFDKPTYGADGQNTFNVEHWSGSFQIFTGVKGGCNMQRIISMHPKDFSKHLIYHVANNKQRQLSRERMVRADHLFGQLNTVVKLARQEKEQGSPKQS